MCLFINSGAVFQLLMMYPDEILDDMERAKMRLLKIPIYLLTLIFLAPHVRQLALVAVRNLPFIMLIVLSAVSTLWSVNGSVTLRRSVSLLMATLLAMLITARFTPRQQVMLFGGTFGLCTILSLLLALTAPAMAFAPGESELRGIFTHKNVFGWIACYTAVFAVAMLRDPSPVVRKLGWTLFATGFTGIVLSQSATSLLGGIFAIISGFALQTVARRDGASRLVTQLVLFQVIAIVVMVLTFNLQVLLETLGRDPTLTGRTELWAAVDPWIGDKLLFGYGYAAFWTESNPAVAQIWDAIGWDAPGAHSSYRDLMLNFGLVGATLFCIVLIQAIRKGTVLLTTEPNEGWLWCLLIIGTSMLSGLSETIMLDQDDVLFPTAVMTIAFRYAELTAGLPRHRRVAIAAA
ncbi:O-antigen ligase family protein [Tropicimonas isoalkanivorans]|uniref:O-antigen ligase family protein n=1 Tax=Tropicimonas isoalkanivorans TaxID=441112 RepID=UPI000B886CA9|nr:O-antigen ligase family protein [Tropicimonas isoalkanivorans]